jgi:quercetin dioxygenase-like cupin family protein
MRMFSLESLGSRELQRAHGAPGGHSTTVVCTGPAGALRLTLVALTAGSWLYEHVDPGEVSLQVLRGRVRIISANTSYNGGSGDVMLIPAARHSLHALTDSVVLLTAANSTQPSSEGQQLT